MRNIGDVYLACPYEIRVSVWILLLVIVLWRLAGRGICWILSVVPWVFRLLSRGIYLMLEMPVAALHKQCGSVFSKIDSHLLRAAEKIDLALDNWYKSWKSYKGLRFGKALLICAIGFALVTFPHYFHWSNSILRFGNTIYTRWEDLFVSLVQKIEWEEPQEADAELKPPAVEYTEEPKAPDITFVVSGVNSSLLVRDVPDVDDCEVLARLHNGDQVTWGGQMTFAEADNEHVEPWVRIMTADGIEGWSRLFYLHPVSFDDRIFYLNESLIQ